MFLSIPFLFLILFRRRKNDLSHDAEFLRPKINTPSARRITATPRNGFSLTTRSAAAEKKAVSAYMTSTTCFCDNPAARRRWWRWFLSGEKSAPLTACAAR